MPACSEVTVDQARTLLQEKSLLILDKRDSQSYQQGHIDGAMLAHDGLIESLVRKRDVERKVLVYCYRGNDSRYLGNMLSSHGYRQVYSLSGGFAEWKRCHD